MEPGEVGAGLPDGAAQICFIGMCCRRARSPAQCHMRRGRRMFVIVDEAFFVRPHARRRGQ
jgi:hypothetical protein